MFMGKCIICNGVLNGNRKKFCSTSCSNRYSNIGKYEMYKDKYEFYNTNSYARQVEKYRYRKFKLIELRGNKGCESCGYIKNIGALDLHHIDPKTKMFQLDSKRLANKSWKSILEEFDKCIILCSNCHREHHNPELNYLDRSIFNERPEINIIDKRCIDCNIEIGYKANRCFECSSINSRIFDRPSIEILLEELSNSSYVSVGKKYGVSDNTIRKWIKAKNPS